MSRIRSLGWLVSVVAGVALIITGPVLAYIGVDGKNQVRAQLKQEQIVTAADAAIANAPVQDPKTAQAQADVIWKHMMETSGGKTYAQMDRKDPNRNTVMTGDMLRSALLSSVLAWNVANLVVGLGALVFGLGLLFIVVGLALKPATVRVPADASALTEPVSATV